MAGKRKRASARDIAELAGGKGSARDRAEAGMGRFKFKKVPTKRKRRAR